MSATSTNRRTYSWTYNMVEDPIGEIDIIEGINHQADNTISLHTCNKCQFTAGTQTGTDQRTSCALGGDCQDNIRNGLVYLFTRTDSRRELTLPRATVAVPRRRSRPRMAVPLTPHRAACTRHSSNPTSSRSGTFRARRSLRISRPAPPTQPGGGHRWGISRSPTVAATSAPTSTGRQL